MKRKLFILVLGSTLFLSLPLFAEVTIIPNNDNPELMIGAIVTSPSRRVTLDLYANDGATIPHYDEGSDSYHVPVVVETTVNVPDPDAVAYGDVTEHPQTIGTAGVVAVPGTDILQLADGTYSNLAPSQTLADALTALGDGVPIPTATDLTNTLPVGTVITVPYADPLGESATDPHKIRITGAFSSIPVNSSSAINSGFYFDNTSCIIYVFTGMSGTTYTYKKLFASRVLEPTLPETEFSSATSDNLGAALEPSQTDFASNGLADDYVNACAAGASCTVVEGDLSQDDVDTWVSTNTTTVNNIISDAISDGAAAAAADGTNTGAQQQQTGQLAGILSALNKLNNTSDEIKDKMDEGYELTGSATLSDDNAYDTDFTQPVENSLSEAVSSYITSGLPLTQFLNESGFTVSNADPLLSCELWGTVVDFDISPMESTLHWMGLIVFAISTVSAFMIVIKR